MDHDERYLVLRKGMHVVGSDGQDVGSINLVEPSYIIVQKGLFPQDYYIPLSAISSYDEETVYLDITKDEALERGLGNPMVAFTEGASGPGTTDATVGSVETAPSGSDTGAIDSTTSEPVADVVDDRSPGTGSMADDPLASDAIVANDRTMDNTGHHQTIELHEEEVTATTRPVERGSVQIRKDVIEEKQTFEVPVVEDEVIVTRRRVNLEPDEGRELFTEDHIEIPLRGHEVQIETQAHVVEEIQIDKAANQYIEEVTETVRHEEARIDGNGVDLDSGDARNEGPNRQDTI